MRKRAREIIFLSIKRDTSGFTWASSYRVTNRLPLARCCDARGFRRLTCDLVPPQSVPLQLPCLRGNRSNCEFSPKNALIVLSYSWESNFFIVLYINVRVHNFCIVIICKIITFTIIGWIRITVFFMKKRKFFKFI